MPQRSLREAYEVLQAYEQRHGTTEERSLLDCVYAVEQLHWHYGLPEPEGGYALWDYSPNTETEPLHKVQARVAYLAPLLRGYYEEPATDDEREYNSILVILLEDYALPLLDVMKQGKAGTTEVVQALERIAEVAK